MAGEDHSGLTIRCAWCGVIIQGSAGASDEAVSHGICERCAPAVIAEIEERLRRAGTPLRKLPEGTGDDAAE
jgi:hypothetical protein